MLLLFPSFLSLYFGTFYFLVIQCREIILANTNTRIVQLVFTRKQGSVSREVLCRVSIWSALKSFSLFVEIDNLISSSCFGIIHQELYPNSKLLANILKLEFSGQQHQCILNLDFSILVGITQTYVCFEGN